MDCTEIVNTSSYVSLLSTQVKVLKVLQHSFPLVNNSYALDSLTCVLHIVNEPLIETQQVVKYVKEILTPLEPHLSLVDQLEKSFSAHKDLAHKALSYDKDLFVAHKETSLWKEKLES